MPQDAVPDPSSSELPLDSDSLLAETSWVRSLAASLVFDQTEVDDVVQEAWVARLETPPKQVRNPRGWLSAVLRNIARDKGRSKSRRLRRERVASRHEALPSTLELVEGVDLHQKLVARVKELPEPFRSTLLLHFFEDLSYPEIASQLNVPEATVRSRLKRGLDRLRDQFDRENGGDRRAWCLTMLSIALPKKTVATAGISSGLFASFKSKLAAFFILALIGVWSFSFFLSNPKTAEIASSHQTLPSHDVSTSEPAKANSQVIPEISRAEINASEKNASFDPVAVRILGVDGRELNTAKTLLMREGRLLYQGQTDSNGFLQLPYSQEGGELWVRIGFFIYREILPDCKTGKTVQVKNNASVSGKVFVNGVAPTEKLPLHFSKERMNFELNELPETARKHLALPENVLVSIKTDELGNFKCLYFPQNWKGNLLVFKPYYLADEQGQLVDKLTFDSPREGVTLQVKRGFSISGRIVDSNGVGIPAVLNYKKGFKVTENSDLSANMTVDSPDFSYSSADGKFKIFLNPWEESEDIKIEVKNSDSSQIKTIQLQKVAKDTELGDITLDLADGITVIVQDFEGNPIPKALATVRRTSLREIHGDPKLVNYMSPFSDSQGKMVLSDLPEQPKSLFIYAEGFQAVEVIVPQQKEGSVLPPILARLPRGNNRLEIQPLQPELKCNVGMMIRLESSDFILLPKHSLQNLTLEKMHVPANVDGFLHFFYVPFSVNPVWKQLAPNIPMHIEIRDIYGGMLLADTEFMLGKEENKIIKIDLSPGYKFMLGKFLDDKGKPIQQASIQGFIEGDDPRNTLFSANLPRFLTNENGELGIASYSPRVSLKIEKEGFETLVLHQIEIAHKTTQKFHLNPIH